MINNVPMFQGAIMEYLVYDIHHDRPHPAAPGKETPRLQNNLPGDKFDYIIADLHHHRERHDLPYWPPAYEQAIETKGSPNMHLVPVNPNTSAPPISIQPVAAFTADALYRKKPNPDSEPWIPMAGNPAPIPSAAAGATRLNFSV